VPDNTSQAVTVLVLVATGSKYETKQTSGISHLLEHLLFKGTKSKPTPIDIVEPLDRVGGAYNAFTGEEYTGYFAKVSKEHFDLALDTISDIYLNSKLDKKEIEKEKGVIVEEINMYYDHPSSYVQTLFTKLLYGDQPAGWDIAGTKETVLKITRDQLASYIGNQYVASNTIVCVAGNIPKGAEFINKIKKHFSGIKIKDPRHKPKVIEKQTKPEALIFNKKTDQTHFCLGVRGYSLFDKRKYAQEILSAMLGGMMSSRLFIRIREELSLCYYIRTNSSSDTDTGFLMTQIGVDNSRVEKAIVEILKEYKKIKDNLVPLPELKKAKDNLRGKLDLSLETSDAQASFYGIQELLEKNILSVEEICDKINKTTRNDIRTLAREIFKPEKLNLALIGPFENKSNFEKLLKI
jgi:predicted Zn-dependent peptidase